MKIQKSITALVIFLYIALIYFSPLSYIDKPKFLLLTITRFPLSLTNRIFYNLNYILHSKAFIDENISLRKNIDILTGRLTQYKEIESENARLKKLLRFKDKSPFKLIAVRVINRDSSNLSDTIVVDRGNSSGIKKDAVVIAEAGLVGHISSASSKMSRVTLITDPDSRVSAVISRSRELGVAYGTSGRLCYIRYLPLESNVAPGDEVTTSGFSGIYPKGLLIGTVIKVTKEERGLSTSALIRPAADISRLEEVLCIE